MSLNGVISRAVNNKQIEAYADVSLDQQSVLKFAEGRRKGQELKQREDKAAEAEADKEVRQKMRKVG